MSEELIRKGFSKRGLQIGSCEYYPIGNTTLDQLRKAKIIPDKNYKTYSRRKPDVLLVNRKDKKKIKVLLVLQSKHNGKFNSDMDKKATLEQCNDLCQVLEAHVGIATDYSSYIWIDPNQKDKCNEYLDKATRRKRSYAIIKNGDGKEFLKDLLKIAIQTG